MSRPTKVEDIIGRRVKITGDHTYMTGTGSMRKAGEKQAGGKR